jgi:DNA-binding NtrC family response regulator
MYGERFGRPGVRLSREALAALMSHPFPGNVRELENAIQAALALAPGDVIGEEDLRLDGSDQEPQAPAADLSLQQVEQQHIDRVLRSVSGNRREAARILGIDRSTLYRKMKQYATNEAKSNNQN